MLLFKKNTLIILLVWLDLLNLVNLCRYLIILGRLCIFRFIFFAKTDTKRHYFKNIKIQI
jgi:hypothetical protein